MSPPALGDLNNAQSALLFGVNGLNNNQGRIVTRAFLNPQANLEAWINDAENIQAFALTNSSFVPLWCTDLFIKNCVLWIIN